MTHAYDSIYLSKVARSMGNMLHDAVVVMGMDGGAFLHGFVQSGVAARIEEGSPKYIAGKSGFELMDEVVELTTGEGVEPMVIENYSRSDAYWVGWLLAYYQWHSQKTFREILDVVSYDDFLNMYDTLHEADIQKSLEVLDEHFAAGESKLKTMRRRCGLTQEELADLSGVSLNTIRAYERKAKDLSKASADIVAKLSTALHCRLTDLL